jgi:hypothetical protein
MAGQMLLTAALSVIEGATPEDETARYDTESEHELDYWTEAAHAGEFNELAFEELVMSGPGQPNLPPPMRDAVELAASHEARVQRLVDHLPATGPAE